MAFLRTYVQALTHASGVIALGAGAVSFTQVVKASEPAFTAAITGVFFKEFLPWQAYAALVDSRSILSLSPFCALHAFALQFNPEFICHTPLSTQLICM